MTDVADIDGIPNGFRLAELIGALPPGELLELRPSSRAVAPIVDLTHDSRAVGPGWIFACVVGAQVDGHAFAAGSVDAGASALVVEHPLALDVSQIVVRDSRRAMGWLAAAVHGHPARRLRMVGITGTNGKTTTSHLLAATLRGGGAGGWATKVIGTLSGARTTPESPDLQRTLAGFAAEGTEAVVMEVSSHALALHRVAGAHFDVGVFTNLGRDHLDLHESIEAYFRAKASLFAPELCAVGVTNLDDPYGRLLLDVATTEMVGFSRSDASDVTVTADAIDFTWRDDRVHVPIGGAFNLMNALAALTVADVLGVDRSLAIAGLAVCPPVPGRFELVTATDDPFAVVVDYAHTPDGLVEVLDAARSLTRAGRVIAVFGCGGDRDPEKRPLMGAAAATHADLVYLTSDNPRHEDPQAIVDAAAAGVDPGYREALRIVVDRRQAIGAAIAGAEPGDVIVIAGKGHETTQTFGDVAHPFDDREVARAALADRERDIPGAPT